MLISKGINVKAELMRISALSKPQISIEKA